MLGERAPHTGHSQLSGGNFSFSLKPQGKLIVNEPDSGCAVCRPCNAPEVFGRKLVVQLMPSARGTHQPKRQWLEKTSEILLSADKGLRQIPEPWASSHIHDFVSHEVQPKSQFQLPKELHLWPWASQAGGMAHLAAHGAEEETLYWIWQACRLCCTDGMLVVGVKLLRKTESFSVWVTETQA